MMQHRIPLYDEDYLIQWSSATESGADNVRLDKEKEGGVKHSVCKIIATHLREALFILCRSLG